jgi:hypothetical protein
MRIITVTARQPLYGWSTGPAPDGCANAIFIGPDRRKERPDENGQSARESPALGECPVVGLRPPSFAFCHRAKEAKRGRGPPNRARGAICDFWLSGAKPRVAEI